MIQKNAKKEKQEEKRPKNINTKMKNWNTPILTHILNVNMLKTFTENLLCARFYLHYSIWS